MALGTMEVILIEGVILGSLLGSLGSSFWGSLSPVWADAMDHNRQKQRDLVKRGLPSQAAKKRVMSPLITARMARELADSESGVSG